MCALFFVYGLCFFNLDSDITLGLGVAAALPSPSFLAEVSKVY